MISHKQLIKTLNQAIYFYFIAKIFQELCQFFYISDSIWPQDADVHALDSGDFFCATQTYAFCVHISTSFC